MRQSSPESLGMNRLSIELRLDVDDLDGELTDRVPERLDAALELGDLGGELDDLGSG